MFLLVICLIAGFLAWRHYKDLQLIKTVTPLSRGEWSERKTVLKLLKMGIDHRAIFHDCYIKRASGTYTQVDLVVATKVGLLAIEVKDYSGWIFGHYRQKYWTQVLAYGKEKYRFYNPIMQNDGHIQAIRENLPHNPDIPIYSIILFFGNSTLKNVTIGSDNDFIIYPDEIKRTVRGLMMRPQANFGNKREIMNMLTEAVSNGTNPEIVSSQRMTASMAGRQRPQTALYYTFNPLALLRRSLRR